MISRTQCPDCGAELFGTSSALCGNCALEGALESAERSRAAAELQPTAGHSFGDYVLLEEIARGGMGVVYKAFQVSLNRTVAIKMILSGKYASREQARRFRAEAEAAAKLLHPNIVRIHQIDETDGMPYFSMDYVGGGNLSRKVKGNSMPAQRAAALVLKVARAIQFAHDCKVFHRDLKPSNILLAEDDEPQVTDFGIAKQGDAKGARTESGEILGSPSFMAPEQAAGKSSACDARLIDVYALGGILFFLLTGRPPFVGETPAATMHAVLHDELVSPRLLNRRIPKDLETICLKCLEKEPQRRYASAREVADDLQRFLNIEPIRARRAGLAHRSTRWMRRNPVGTALILSLFAGCAVSLGLLNRLQQESTAKETALDVLLNEIGVNRLWQLEDSEIVVPSEVLWLATGHPAPKTPGRPRIKLGLMVEKDPVSFVMTYAFLATFIEKELNAASHPTLIDLVLFKKNEVAVGALASNRVQVVKIGAASIIKAEAMSPIQLLVSQHPVKQGVIFTRSNSGIAKLEDLRGRSVALGDRYSTLSTRACGHLVEAGVTNPARYEFIDSIAYYAARPELLATRSSLSNHELTIEAVKTNGFDAGVCSQRYFDQLGRPAGMRALKIYTSDPVFWVASAGVRTNLASAMRAALVSFKNTKVIPNMQARKASGAIAARPITYVPANKADIDEFRKAAAVTATYFGGDNDIQEE